MTCPFWSALGEECRYVDDFDVKICLSEELYEKCPVYKWGFGLEDTIDICSYYDFYSRKCLLGDVKPSRMCYLIEGKYRECKLYFKEVNKNDVSFHTVL